MVPNKYKVGKDKWTKWSESAKRVFNNTYSTMYDDQQLFMHPKAPVIKHAHWKTISWNAAWIAADSVPHDFK